MVPGGRRQLLHWKEMSLEIIGEWYNQKLIYQYPSFITLLRKTAHLYWISCLIFFLNKKNHVPMSHHDLCRSDRAFSYDNTYENFLKITTLGNCTAPDLLMWKWKDGLMCFSHFLNFLNIALTITSRHKSLFNSNIQKLINMEKALWE